MGLDVQVVNGLTRIPDEEVPDGMEPYSEEFYEWEENTDNYIKFIDRENGYFEKYWTKHLDPFKTGYYRDEGDSEHSFRVGSYSYYGNWRKLLALAIGFEHIGDIWKLGPYNEDIPFIELLDFSDADGNLGPTVSNKLYNDFEGMQDRVYEFIDNMMFGVIPGNKLNMTEVRDFKIVYEDWKLAFEIARDSGMVSLQ
jgi:hypothetical protein|tara:strand:+ start:653 stop:1243 length:591 start_codon:yes stop_codon:yes gene_type:complete